MTGDATRASAYQAYTTALASWSDIGDQLEWLTEQATMHQVVAELGVRSGRSTAAFLWGCAISGGRLWSVDIAAPDVPLGWFDFPHWRFAQCDSISSQAQMFLPPEIGLLFIDTSHTTVQTLAELRAYAGRVRPGGLICCHDTQWDVGDVSLPAPGGPVTEALDQFCAETGQTWVNRDSEQGQGYGLGVITWQATA